MKREVIVHGLSCPEWSQPEEAEGWLDLELVWEEDGQWTYGTCPACGRHVFISYDGGMLDFGMEPGVGEHGIVRVAGDQGR